MPSGGYRAGAGRPRGARDSAPRKRPRVPSDQCSPGPDEAASELTGTQKSPKPSVITRDQAESAAISYLTEVVQDETADGGRRDRAAIALLSLTRAKPAPPKRRERDELDKIMGSIGLRI
jgi:hypothetical protein